MDNILACILSMELADDSVKYAYRSLGAILEWQELQQYMHRHP